MITNGSIMMAKNTSNFQIALLLLLLLANSAVHAQRVSGARFIDAGEDNYIPIALTPGNTINYAVLPHVDRFNILLETTVETTASVFITLDKPRRSFCERKRPFGLYPNSLPGGGPHGLGKFQGRLFKLGRRVLEATPFAGSDCTGRSGNTFRMEFDVVNMTEVKLTVEAAQMSLQPRVTTVEANPARRVSGILEIGTAGTPWCGGHPTYWAPGHKPEDDTPNCYVNGTWTRPFAANLDRNDALNAADSPFDIDRHDCGVIDANNDGIDDIYCLVGANVGGGVGYNELYLSAADGTIRKVLRHGLQKYLGMRTRHTTILRGPSGAKEFVFLSTFGEPRADGRSNVHRMFRKTGVVPYFEEEHGPWTVNTRSSFVRTVDFNQDGLDDLLVGNEREHALMYLQGVDRTGLSTWTAIPLNQTNRQKFWRSARVGDFSGDGIPDLLVVNYGYESFLQVFRGIRQAPFFDFSPGAHYFTTLLPHSAPDVEVMDVNGDGILDFYAVQVDTRPKNEDGTAREGLYCGGKWNPAKWWPNGGILPPVSFTPPRDTANDFLFMGRGDLPEAQRRQRFDRVTMEHSEPGCGFLVRPFGEKKLLLTQGDFVHHGHQLFLEWS